MKTVLSKALICFLSVCLASVTFFSCATGPSKQMQATGIGGVIGALTGALIDKKHSWRGGILGGLAGAAAGYTLAEISERAASEAVKTNKEVKYDDGQGRVVTSTPIKPASYKPSKNTPACKGVINRVWENGELISENIQNVCDEV